MENKANTDNERDCKIFLVDDDADDREFFSDALNDVGEDIRLTLFSSEEELLSILGFRRPIAGHYLFGYICL